MATIAPVTTPLNSNYDHAHTVLWETLTAADTATPVAMPGEADRSVQVTGTFGGTVSIKGSNDGVNYETLTDPLGAPLDFAAAGLKQISEITAFIKPTAGAGVTDVDVTMLTRRPMK